MVKYLVTIFINSDSVSYCETTVCFLLLSGMTEPAYVAMCIASRCVVIAAPCTVGMRRGLTIVRQC